MVGWLVGWYATEYATIKQYTVFLSNRNIRVENWIEQIAKAATVLKESDVGKRSIEGWPK